MGLRPVREEPDVGIEIGVGDLVAEVAAFFALGLGGAAVFGEDALERGYGEQVDRWPVDGRIDLADNLCSSESICG